MKRYFIRESSGKWKLQPRQHTTTRLLEWPTLDWTAHSLLAEGKLAPPLGKTVWQWGLRCSTPISLHPFKQYSPSPSFWLLLTAHPCPSFREPPQDPEQRDLEVPESSHPPRNPLVSDWCSSTEAQLACLTGGQTLHSIICWKAMEPSWSWTPPEIIPLGGLSSFPSPPIPHWLLFAALL